MRSSNYVVWVALLSLLLFVQCGGRSVRESDPAPSVDTAPNDGGAEGGADGGDCDDPPAPPCGGGSNVDPATGVHLACGDVTVNRRGMTVTICHHIK